MYIYRSYLSISACAYIYVCVSRNLRRFKPRWVSAVVCWFVVVGTMTRCALVPSLCDLKAAQMNVQGIILSRTLMLCLFELSYNIAETNKHVCCVKVEGAIDHCTETRVFKKFHSGFKNLHE